jgi:alkylation response protein AidB-like acyl-CoA dehydrogenase
MIPKAVGGASESWLDVAIALEEYYTVDASLTIHAVGTALGLLPLIIGGTPEQQKKYLAPFTSGEGEHLASLTRSEPGGTANFLETGGNGLGVTAKQVGDYYIVNGEKVSLRSYSGLAVSLLLTSWCAAMDDK